MEGLSSASMAGMGHGGGATTDMAANVDRLREAPVPFDLAFIDAVVAHRQSGIDAARAAESRAQKPEIKQLAKDIIAAQEREIRQMQDWRKAWYGGA